MEGFSLVGGYMKIITDTSSLISPKDGEKLGITVLPVSVSINGQSYKDYTDIDNSTMLSHMNNGSKVTSSQPSIGDMMNVYIDEQDTLVLSIGDGLSGTYSTHIGVKNSLDSNEHIHIIDSKTLAGPLNYLVRKAIELKEKNISIEEIKQKLITCIETSHSFVIPFDFEFLKRSGRLTPIAAKIISATKIIPVLTQSEDKRRIEVYKINRTVKKAIGSIINKFKSLNIDENYVISICHAGGYEKAMQAYELLKKEFSNTLIEVFELSPALCCHGGPGSITIQVIKL